MRHVLREEMLVSFEKGLAGEEKSRATIEKYMRDVRCFFYYISSHACEHEGQAAAAGSLLSAAGRSGCRSSEREISITKEQAVIWKENLKEKYAPASVNSMIASVNHFFTLSGLEDCRMKSLKFQRVTFRSADKELTRDEYVRLIRAAEEKGNRRLSCLMQTMGSTGIRVSELPFITAEAIARGQARVSMKGKQRTVLLPGSLRALLRDYMRERGITTGSIFITKSGRPMDRSNILHEMKSLCEAAGVKREKVFPHNLRHLFACTYYKQEKDIVHLADLLGHTNMNTTRIYTMVSMEEQEQQLNGMDMVIGNEGRREMAADSRKKARREEPCGNENCREAGRKSCPGKKARRKTRRENRKKDRKKTNRHFFTGQQTKQAAACAARPGSREAAGHEK